MHATRAAVYYFPHLDSLALRKRKLQIFIDDDGLPGGNTHHYQLTRAFRSIGTRCVLDDEEFGDPDDLCRHLTAHFVRVARRLYSYSLGPWCAIETLSPDWMHALAQALSVHVPQFKAEPYFAECFSQMVEEHYAAEAIEMTQIVLASRAELLATTMRDAKTHGRGARRRNWTGSSAGPERERAVQEPPLSAARSLCNSCVRRLFFEPAGC